MGIFGNIYLAYWLYNQIFFLVGALGFLLVLFIVGLLGLGALDSVIGFAFDLVLLSMLYKWFGRFYWRSKLEDARPWPGAAARAAVVPVILGSIILTICFAFAGGDHKATMLGMPFLAVVNLSFAYLPLANSVWTMLVIAIAFNMLTIFCFSRYCREYANVQLPLVTMAQYLLLCFVLCTVVIYYFTLQAL